MPRLDADWLLAHGGTPDAEWPRCQYCGTRVRRGGWVDSAWPLYDYASTHQSCAVRAQRQWREFVRRTLQEDNE